MQQYAPVIIPTLNRFEHFKQCLESLEMCMDADKTEVYVGLDFPSAEKHVAGWKRIDEYLKRKEQNNGFLKLIVERREHNCGCANRMTSNSALLRERILAKFERWIFSEDDNIFSPNFLQYMNYCLAKYELCEDIVAVSGYSYPVEWQVSEGATCFMQNVCFSMWGTGFWKNKYNSMSQYLRQDALRKSLNRSIVEFSYLRMIDAAKQGFFIASCSMYGYRVPEYDAWRFSCDFVCRCYLAVENKYVISPVISKVKNMGFDGSGVCCQTINGGFGNTAGTYNYNQQPIDKSSTFVLIEDTLHDDNANRVILNTFDYRSPEQMKRTNTLIWLCEHIGCWAAKLYQRTLQPFDLILQFYNLKIKK